MLFRNLLFTLGNDSGTWKTLANYSQYVNWGTLATDGNFVYSFGSHSTINTANGSCYKWAKATNTWTQIATMGGSDGNYACYYGGFFYIFATNNSVLKYDPILNTFSLYASMPVVGEKWYGCLVGAQVYITFGDYLHMFDINGKFWSGVGAQIPRGSTGVVSKYPGVAYVPSTGDIYLIGGTDSPERIVAYSTWYTGFQTLSEKLPTGEGRHAMAAVTSGSNIYICGGMSAINTATKTSYVYNTSNNSMTKIADMPSAFGRTGSVLFDGWIMVLCGYYSGISNAFYGYVI